VVAAVTTGAAVLAGLLPFSAPAAANTSSWHSSYNSKCVDADLNRINQNGTRVAALLVEKPTAA